MAKAPLTSHQYVPHTKRALAEFWRRHQVKLSALPNVLYNDLDALIRADERYLMGVEGNVPSLAQRYDDLVGENARLTRMMEGRHALGTCPHCERPERPRPVPMAVVALVFGISGALVMSLAHVGVALLWD